MVCTAHMLKKKKEWGAPKDDPLLRLILVFCMDL